jgi:uncharacterized circularly permuted ATP-grasp superfamily protein
MAARYFDEMLDWRDDGAPALIHAGQALPDGAVRPHYRHFAEWLARQTESTMGNKLGGLSAFAWASSHEDSPTGRRNESP